MAKKNTIAIGNQTAFSAAEILDPFHYACEKGFDSFEWFPDKKEWGGWASDELSLEDTTAIKAQAKKHKIALTVHASQGANPLTQEGRDTILKDATFGKAIGAKLINIHIHPEDGIPAFIEAILPLCKKLKGLRVGLALENTPMVTPEQINELFRLLPENPCGKSPFGLCFDVGHANICSITHNDYIAYVDALDSSIPIIHLHMHENNGDYDSHLPLFTGPAAQNPAGIRLLVQRMVNRGFSGNMVLEVWPHDPNLLVEARTTLQSMIEEARAIPAAL